MFYLLHFILLSYFTGDIYTLAEKYPRSEKNGQGMYDKTESRIFLEVYLITCLHNNRESGKI